MSEWTQNPLTIVVVLVSVVMVYLLARYPRFRSVFLWIVLFPLWLPLSPLIGLYFLGRRVLRGHAKTSMLVSSLFLVVAAEP